MFEMHYLLSFLCMNKINIYGKETVKETEIVSKLKYKKYSVQIYCIKCSMTHSQHKYFSLLDLSALKDFCCKKRKKQSCKVPRPFLSHMYFILKGLLTCLYYHWKCVINYAWRRQVPGGQFTMRSWVTLPFVFSHATVLHQQSTGHSWRTQTENKQTNISFAGK